MPTDTAVPIMPSVNELAAERVAAVAARKRKPATASSNGKPTTAKAKAKTRTGGDTADLVAAGIGYQETAKGRDNKHISQRPTPKEVAKARRVLRKLNGDTIPAKLGLSEAKLRAFVRGDVAMGELGDAGKAGVKQLTKGIGSHQVWARKAAALAWGIHKTAK